MAEILCECIDTMCDKAHSDKANEKFLKSKKCKHKEWESSVGDVLVCVDCKIKKTEIEDQTSDPFSFNIACKCGSKEIEYPTLNNHGDKDWSSAFCMKCGAIFDPWNSENKPSYSLPKYEPCFHEPTNVIKGQNSLIYVGKRIDCERKVNDFDIVINLSGSSVKYRGHIIPIKELSKFRNPFKQSFVELLLDWPDMGIPYGLGLEFWKALVEYIESKNSKVLIFCIGGHGRTGTAVASLLITMLNYSAKESIDWVKQNYCNKAIETKKQVEYIYSLTGEIPPEIKSTSTGVSWNAFD